MRLFTLPNGPHARATDMTYPERISSDPLRSVRVVKTVPTPDPALAKRFLSKRGPAKAPIFAPAPPLPTPPAPVVRRLENPEIGAAVELELPASPKLRGYFVPRYGASVTHYLYNVRKSTPRFLEKWLSEYNDWRRDVGLPRLYLYELRFTDLDDDMLQRLLTYGSGQELKTFRECRIIAGIHFNTRVPLVFRAPTRLFGRDYAPGRHETDLIGALSPDVEFASPQAARDLSEVELHVRRLAPAGDVSRDAWTLLDALGLPRVGQHVHMPAKLPVERLRAKPLLQSARMGEFHGRINVTAEMIHIVFHRRQIWHGKFFGPMSGRDLEKITKRLLRFGTKRTDAICCGYEFKHAFVAFRGEDRYDEVHRFGKMYGEEYRAIIPEDEPEVICPVLDAIQWSMHNDDYGIAPERIQDWLGLHLVAITHATDLVSKTYYNHDWKRVFANAPYEIRTRLDLRNRAVLRYMSHRNLEVKMLLHDWGKHPLFFEERHKQERILDAQRHALEKVLAFRGPQPVVRDFLIESGLYEWVPGSLGLRLPTGPKAAI